jgi:hypothetical protein
MLFIYGLNPSVEVFVCSSHHQPCLTRRGLGSLRDAVESRPNIVTGHVQIILEVVLFRFCIDVPIAACGVVRINISFAWDIT